MGLFSGRALVFIAAVMLSLAIGISLRLANNPHADTLFIVVFYATALPALVWWLRGESTTGSDYVLRLPDLRIPVIVLFGLLVTGIGLTYGPGHTFSDESAYQFQARIFAAGQLKADPLPGAPQNPALTPPEIYFENQIDSARGWFAKYPPAWPLLLAVGYFARCPWLINPVLGVILLLLVNYLARPWGLVTQNLAVLIAACSGYTVIYTIGFMSHAFSAVLAAACLASLLYGVRTGRMRGIILCFLLVVIETETRPYNGAVIALLCTGYTLYQFRRKPKLFWPSFGVIAVAGLLSAALFLLINKTYTGEYLLSPYAYAHGSHKVNEITFNPVRILENIVTVWRWVVTTTLSFTFPFLVVAAGYACWKETRFRNELLCLAALFPLLMTAYLFQTVHSSSFDGERFYFEGFAPVCIVAARGMALLASRWRVAPNSAKVALATFAVVGVVFIGMVIRDVEERLAPWHREYRASLEQPAPALVFLSGSAPLFAPKHVNWNQVHWEKEATLFLNDPGPDRRNALACQFHRPGYRVVWFDFSTERAVSRDFVAQCPAQIRQ